MTGSLAKLSLRELEPYSIEEYPSLRGVIKLDANENQFVDNNKLIELLKEVLTELDLRTYPKPFGGEAVGAIAKFLGLPEENVVVGNGSDEILDCIIKAFVGYDDEVIVNEPTFEMYSYLTKLAGGRVRPVFLSDSFSLNVEAVLSAVTDRTKIVFICSPNNPTGNQFEEEEVRRIIKETEGLVVVDEAYVDFARYSAVGWINEFENLIVTRTFSKSFGLAGFRIGYAAADEKISSYIRRAALPYSVDSLAQRIAEKALEEWRDYFNSIAKRVKEEREFLFKSLSNFDSLKVYPSDANFLLVRVTGQKLTSKIVRDELLKRGIIVRDRSFLPKLENCLRITVGTREMNLKLLEALNDILR
jgi:histidinol-phosphate aminotransferase